MKPALVKTRVAVVFGGQSVEHDVSCRSAASVVAHLDRARYEVIPVWITPSGRWIVGKDDPDALRPGDVDVTRLLDMVRPESGGPTPPTRAGSGLPAAVSALAEADVVFPCLHGPFGEDGTVQGLLELAGVPYVGSGVAASAVGMDKELTKKVLAANGIAVTDDVVLGPDDALSRTDRERLGLPVFVKPARAGSSIGVSRVDAWNQLDAALASARECDSKVLVEAAVSGEEIDLGVLELPGGALRVGPLLRIHTGRRFFDYDAKYTGGDTVFEVPAEVDPDTADRLSLLALAAFRALGCSGLLRVDFLIRTVDGRHVPVVNEVNTMPGFTVASQFPQMWQAAGLGYGELLDVLVGAALERP